MSAPPAPRARIRAPDERQVIAHARALALSAATLLNLEAPEDLRQPARAIAHVQLVRDAALESLREGAPGSDVLRALLVDALELEWHLDRHMLARRAARRAALRRGLDALRPTTDPSGLVERICPVALRSCGMRRAFMSRVSEGVWSAWKCAHADESDGNALDWAGIEPIDLDDLPIEGTVARERRPLLVERPEDDARIHPALAVFRSAPFVVAPITAGDTVIGLLHVDRLGEAREVDKDDAGLTWAFTEGFGQLYERAVFRRRLSEQRAITRHTARLQELMTSDDDPTHDLSVTHEKTLARSTATETDSSDVLEQLTAREREVLHLVACGLSNEDIGSRLVISPATAKSHVRSVLRKVGAVNRAQAIAVYVSATRQPPQ